MTGQHEGHSVMAVLWVLLPVGVLAGVRVLVAWLDAPERALQEARAQRLESMTRVHGAVARDH